MDYMCLLSTQKINAICWTICDINTVGPAKASFSIPLKTAKRKLGPLLDEMSQETGGLPGPGQMIKLNICEKQKSSK